MEFNLNDIKEFPVSIYGNFEKISEVASKARVRIFYKGMNRNGSYITDTFAEELIKTLPYSPVKGIFDEESEDYTDHGEKRTQGRAYGVVMGPNDLDFAWEKHMDEDGVEREYACANVLLWTSLYSEANQIVGKSQSMELYEPSIEGSIKFINGKRCFEYTKGCFLGLQVLGENVEPCFEGSAFFSLAELYKKMLDELKNYSFNKPEELVKGEQTIMPVDKFKLSDSQKADAIFQILNAGCDLDNWECKYVILDVYEKYALVYNYELSQYEQVDYVKSDENDSVELGEHRVCYIMDITEAEKAALDLIHAANGGTYENLNENFVSVENMAEKDSKIEELNNSLSTLQVENENLKSEAEVAATKISDLEADNEALKTFKYNVEKQEKIDAISNYNELLDKEVLDKYVEDVDNFTIDTLKKELAFALVEKNPTIFTKTVEHLPKDAPTGGIEEILSKYQK